MSISGCVSQQMNDGLADLNGKNIREASARLGPPNNQWQLMDTTMYVWTSGQARFNPAGGSLPGQHGCSIQIATDAAGTIKSSQWMGDRSDCSGFANAFLSNSLGLPR